MAKIGITIVYNDDTGQVLMTSKSVPATGLGWIKCGYEEEGYVATAYHGNYANLREASIHADLTEHHSVRAAMCAIAQKHYENTA